MIHCEGGWGEDVYQILKGNKIWDESSYTFKSTVDGRNPAPPGMYETL